MTDAGAVASTRALLDLGERVLEEIRRVRETEEAGFSMVLQALGSEPGAREVPFDADGSCSSCGAAAVATLKGPTGLDDARACRNCGRRWRAIEPENYLEAIKASAGPDELPYAWTNFPMPHGAVLSEAGFKSAIEDPGMAFRVWQPGGGDLLVAYVKVSRA